jgi:hypothetical protein
VVMKPIEWLEPACSPQCALRDNPFQENHGSGPCDRRRYFPGSGDANG